MQRTTNYEKKIAESEAPRKSFEGRKLGRNWPTSLTILSVSWAAWFPRSLWNEIQLSDSLGRFFTSTSWGSRLPGRSTPFDGHGANTDARALIHGRSIDQQHLQCIWIWFHIVLIVGALGHSSNMLSARRCPKSNGLKSCSPSKLFFVPVCSALSHFEIRTFQRNILFPSVRPNLREAVSCSCSSQDYTWPCVIPKPIYWLMNRGGILISIINGLISIYHKPKNSNNDNNINNKE